MATQIGYTDCKTWNIDSLLFLKQEHFSH